jgi:hypothetical protein
MSRLGLTLVLLALTTALASSGPSTGGEGIARDVRPFLKEHCFRCHGEDEQKGGLRLDDLPLEFVTETYVDRWLEVIERLNAGTMPPESVWQRPPAEASARIAGWLSAQIAEGDAERRATRACVSFHRLTREEYAHTVADLLAVQFDVADAAGLNDDDEWRGFRRVGSALSTSASHVEKYLAAAEAILDEAYPEQPTECGSTRYSAVDLVGGPETFGRERYAQLEEADRVDHIRIDLWPGQLVRATPSGGWVERAGTYRVRIGVSGLRSRTGRAPHLAVYAETIDRLLFERDVVAPERDPTVIEFEAHLPVGAHEFTLENTVPGPTILQRVGRAGLRPFFSLAEGRVPWQLELVDEDGVPVRPLLIIDWVEWEGPLSSDAEQRRARYLPRTTASDELRGSLARFATDAFRRPLNTGEIEPYVHLVERELAAGASLQSSVKASLAAILCSQPFLFLVEGGLDRGEALNAWELASRLSYFLWSTAPDARLLELAESGRLCDDEVLRGEVERLLTDPRVERFADSFARQWLQLDRVGQFTPSVELYPDYDEHLERSMVRETTAFFGEVLSKDLSLREFLTSDWTLVNARLALHYGISGIDTDSFQTARLQPAHHRGGVLTHASVLSLTSDGTRHRPVHRGVWLSESIFGETPPPPPANVDPIEPNPIESAKATIRMQLEAHRANETCAACHRRIDPLGLAFDNYDAIGRWRTEEIVPTGVGSNPPVDASGTLADGRSFSGPAEFAELLVQDLDSFHAAFVEKLATYALRRPMGVADRGELERIAARSAANGYRLQQLVESLILSDLFAHR